MKTVWLRGEVNPNERRTPLIPADAASLVALGYEVHVETAPNRVFSDEVYRAHGCIIEARDSWRQKRAEAVTLGIKLPELTDDPLYGEHVFYAHQYTRSRILSEKPTALKMLERFARGGGTHYDVEYLVDESGIRVPAFSSVAGSVGAILAILLWSRLQGERMSSDQRLFVAPTTIDALAVEAQSGLAAGPVPSVAVLGAGGYCGAGATAALDRLGIAYSKIPRQALLASDVDARLFDYGIIVNCMAADETTPKILNPANVGPASKIRIVSDIGCETNTNNPLLLRGRLSSIDAPFYTVSANGKPVEVIAIDHLPAITPLESSVEFSRQMTPLLLSLLSCSPNDATWTNAQAVFQRAMHCPPRGALQTLDQSLTK